MTERDIITTYFDHWSCLAKFAAGHVETIKKISFVKPETVKVEPDPQNPLWVNITAELKDGEIKRKRDACIAIHRAIDRAIDQYAINNGLTIEQVIAEIRKLAKSRNK